jgi:hypothetical protein
MKLPEETLLLFLKKVSILAAGSAGSAKIYMSDKTFVDTNILVYAHDLDAGKKHEKAKKTILKKPL